jgi:hypothetical protein
MRFEGVAAPGQSGVAGLRGEVGRPSAVCHHVADITRARARDSLAAKAGWRRLLTHIDPQSHLATGLHEIKYSGDIRLVSSCQVFWPDAYAKKKNARASTGEPPS